MGDSADSRYQAWESNEEIRLFREYLKIPSVHPDVDYGSYGLQAASLDLPVKVIEVNPKKPVVIISWEGTDPAATSIILNSHMDVVPVYPERWTYPPFSAHMDAEGRIYARGSQDMKCVGMQFLAVVRALKRDGVRLKRTLHVMFVPDEETGGVLGMKDFVTTDHFKALNCGFAIDEGLASENEVFKLFYGERLRRKVFFYISGTPGHGSLLLEGTAGEKARKLLDRLYDFRSSEAKKLEDNSELTIGDTTIVNLTMMEGGVQSNVVPPELMICTDIRVAPTEDIDQFEAQIARWCEESGGGIRADFGVKDPVVGVTKLDDTNLFWGPFKAALDELGLKIKPQIMPGATDVRFIREQGIPAVGFSPMNNTPVLLHDHDEFLQADTYLKGIEIYRKIVVGVANV
ncbi:hypothetical protein pipiens_002762 [Culex pipiens pipiens]|uniref:N-acyl-aliphatic-L-amino acid amidohydrolase n=1 Tax=Culex pipiens pipiens TaxID=38569 RepID=A0ABD1DC07_CULPP